MKKLLWIIFGGLSIIISFYPIRYFLAEKPVALLLSKSVELLDSNLYAICFYLHIAFGGLALLIGWIQFSEKLRNHYRKLHRIIGKVYVTSVIVSGVPGLYIALHATGGLSPKLGFFMGAVLWLIFTLTAFTRARKGKIESHRKLMIYSYAGTFGAVTLRLWLPLLILIFQDFIDAYQIVAWLSWLPNMIVAYLIINKTRVFKLKTT